jgi:hypothetical protein
MFLKGVSVATMANHLGWSTHKLYRVLRDDQAISDVDFDRIETYLAGISS